MFNLEVCNIYVNILPALGSSKNSRLLFTFNNVDYKYEADEKKNIKEAHLVILSADEPLQGNKAVV
jgi:hypothetical protein